MARPIPLVGVTTYYADAAWDSWRRPAAIAPAPYLELVHLGGTPRQHLSDLVGHSAHQPGPGRFGDVEVEIEAGTRAPKVFGERAQARCSHHQSVGRIGRGLVPTAWAREPGSPSGDVIEALELEGARFVLAVQWHPEEQGDLRAFRALVDAAR